MVPLTRGNSEKSKDNSIHMNELIIFNNEEFGEIRTITINGEPWFVGKDVATALGYKNTKDALKSHTDEEDKKILQKSEITTLENIPNRGLTIINESGMYALIFGSKLESAKNVNYPSSKANGLPASQTSQPTISTGVNSGSPCPILLFFMLFVLILLPVYSSPH